MGKAKRLEAIKQLVQQEIIASQDILLEKLNEKGFSSTQATLSRDIKELKIVKVHTADGLYAYRLRGEVLAEDSPLNPVTALGFLSLEFSGNLCVMKTRPGYAMAIAAEIDKKASDIILGTVAGDDTILIIPKENISRTHTIDVLTTFIPTLK